MRRLLLLLALLLPGLAGCGACEGRLTNSGQSHGLCTVLSVDL
jgi:hypothetical protein